MPGHGLHLLGLSDEYVRLEWVILTVMPAPPPPARLSIAVSGGAMRSEDDLTYKLGDIIKASANVRRCEQEGAPAHAITEFEQLPQVRFLFPPPFGCHSIKLMCYSSMLPRTWIMTPLVYRKRCRSPADL